MHCSARFISLPNQSHSVWRLFDVLVQAIYCKKTQRFKQVLIIQKVLCKPSLVKCNGKKVQDETSFFRLLGTH